MVLCQKLQTCERVSGYRLAEPSSDTKAAAADTDLAQPNADKAVSEAATALRPDFDRAWKDALRWWLPDCLRLFWPEVHDQINWAIPPEFLATELRRLKKSFSPMYGMSTNWPKSSLPRAATPCY